MAAANAPITMKETLTLTSLGINPQFITFTNVTMESDKYICVRETAPQNSVVIINMNMPMQPLRRPITADSALMNPNTRILALKASLAGTTQDHLQILNIEAKAKLKSYQMPEQVVFWKWITPKMLGLVTQTSVYHWSIEGESEPVKMFDRTSNLANNQIINYRRDPSEKWLVLIGIAPGSPERAQLVKGNMQLFSVEQQRSQSLEAHAASFASFRVSGNDKDSILISFATKTSNAGQVTSKLHVIELGAQPGRPSFTKKQQDLFFPPDFADDFPVAMQISHKYSLIYVITKLGLLFVYDLETATAVYRNRISPDPIFLTSEASSVGGFYAINRRGQVLLATVNEATIVPFVSGQLNNLELAVSLAKRGNLPGAENLVVQHFQDLFAQTKYKEAAELAAESPQGILRTPDTIAKFQSVPVQAGQTPPLLQYFGTLLTKGKLNGFESLELSRLVVNQNKKNLLENWLAEDKLECSEELGDLVKTVDNDLALKIYIKARATPKVVAAFAERREFDKILIYSKQMVRTNMNSSPPKKKRVTASARAEAVERRREQRTKRRQDATPAEEAQFVEPIRTYIPTVEEPLFGSNFQLRDDATFEDLPSLDPHYRPAYYPQSWDAGHYDVFGRGFDQQLQQGGGPSHAQEEAEEVGGGGEEEEGTLLDVFDAPPEPYNLYHKEFDHVARHIRNGKDRGVLSCKQCCGKACGWNLSRESTEVQKLVKGSALYNIFDSWYIVTNKVLISGFVERWYGETNTFHLPFGEMTITLDDVHQILGLPVTGRPMLKVEERPLEQKRVWVSKLLGIPENEVDEELKACDGQTFTTVRTQWLISQLERPQGGGRDVRGANHVQVVRGYMLMLLGCTLFQDMSHDKVKVKYLHYLEDMSPEALDGWAWGAGFLAYMYRMLGKASIGSTKGACGYLTMIEAWVYEYFPSLRNGPRQDVFSIDPPTKRWPQSKRIATDIAAKLLIDLRGELDEMTADEVLWTPYRARDADPSEVVWFYGILSFDTVLEPYHPNRVVRQFGRVQDVPHIPIQPTRSHKRKTKLYKVEYDPSLATSFDDLETSLLPAHIRGNRASQDGECTDDYFRWYTRNGTLRLTLAKEGKKYTSGNEYSKKSTLDVLQTFLKKGLRKCTKNELFEGIKRHVEAMMCTCTNDAFHREEEGDGGRMGGHGGRSGGRSGRQTEEQQRRSSVGIRIEEPSEQPRRSTRRPRASDVEGKGKGKMHPE